VLRSVLTWVNKSVSFIHTSPKYILEVEIKSCLMRRNTSLQCRSSLVAHYIADVCTTKKMFVNLRWWANQFFNSSDVMWWPDKTSSKWPWLQIHSYSNYQDSVIPYSVVNYIIFVRELITNNAFIMARLRSSVLKWMSVTTHNTSIASSAINIQSAWQYETFDRIQVSQ